MTGTAEKIITFLLAKTGSGLFFDLTEHKAKRTLTQNAYYWVLLEKVAAALRMSKPELHNRMLRQYGVWQRYGDKVVVALIADTDEAEETALRAEKLHLKPTSVTIESEVGTMRQYVLLKGTHEMNTEEMSVLLDGLIQEARNLDIETLTPAELERMRQYAQENKGNRDTEESKGNRIQA